MEAALKPLRHTSSIDTKIEEVISSISSESEDNNTDSLKTEAASKSATSTSASAKLDLLVAKVRESSNLIVTHFLFSHNGGMLRRVYKYSSMEDLMI